MELTGQTFGGIALGPRPAAAGRAPQAGTAQPAVRRTDAYRGGLKRALDLLAVLMVSLPVLLVLLPLVLLVALDGGKPFFVQERLGRGGRVFRMIKLRTMVPDADRVLAATLAADPAARAEWDHHQKLRRDPRVTRIGGLLRRTSLDELPQLLNVALGHMSLVGPRPMLPSQREIYPGTEYFEMRPGITGFWQISERHESSFADRAAFDRRYHEEQSLLTDLRVLWATVGVVGAATGC